MGIGTVATTAWKGVAGLPRKVFGTRNDRLLKVYRNQIPAISALESEIRGTYDEDFAAKSQAVLDADVEEEEVRAQQLQALRLELSQDLLDRTQELRTRVRPLMAPLDEWWHGLTSAQQFDEHFKSEYRARHNKAIAAMDDEGVAAAAFAVLREASRRAQEHRHFDCQLIGGRVLFEGKIAEMRTGEGKTIVCHLAAFLRVISGHNVHIITVNDYLVKRDAEFAASIFELVGVSVGFIQAQLDPSGREGTRQAAYSSDITYGTNSEFGFDYLRDNMKNRRSEQVQGRLDYVIVDEVDSILIDEARTPLIISGSAGDDVTRYPRADMVAKELVRQQAVWDRKILSTVARFDGDAKNIPKLEDAMNICGYREKRTPAKEGTSDSEDNLDMPTLGADFLTDDQVEAIQIYENDILQLPAAEQYRRFFIVQLERKQVGLTHDGVTIAQDMLDMGSLYSGANMEWPHLVENALRAHKVYQRDKDYVVQDGQIIIVDPFTGRLMHGRQWSDGLHQAVEAREAVKVKEETQTLATITIQNFIKLYQIKAGMTGTALTEATEFDKIYKLEVIEIPTNRPINRVDHNDKMYRDEEQKYGAIVDEIHEVHRRGRPADPFLMAEALAALLPIVKGQGKDVSQIESAIKQFNKAELGDQNVTRFMLEVYDESMGNLSRGRPVLVGTTSVENSEKLAKLLERRYGIDHEVLNAKNHAREADIVTKAGYTTMPSKGGDRIPMGNVTIATNMAGRGTDIKLGPNVVYETCRVPETLPEGSVSSPLYPVGLTKCCINCEEYDAATNCAHCFKPKLDPRFPALGRTVCPVTVPCGLHIIATERHESRRIDNQLRGRAGRQGDPGSSRFSLSLQDELLKLFMPDWMLKMMDKLGFADGGILEDKRLTKGIERAQRKVEERNYATRKHLLEWDEPMDYQRKEFYTQRQRILEERDLPSLIFSTIDSSLTSMVDQCLAGRYDRACIAQWCGSTLEIAIDEDRIDTDDLESAEASIRRKAIDEAHDVIRTSIGEYIDPEEPPAQWDVGGLLKWAARTYNVTTTQNQLRKMDAEQIEELMLTAAVEHYTNMDLSGVALFLDPEFPARTLADWSRAKFNVEFALEDVKGNTSSDVRARLDTLVHEAYRQREISYPAEAVIERAFDADTMDRTDGVEFVATWVKQRYGVTWAAEHFEGKTVAGLKEELIELSRSFFDGKLEEEFRASLDGKSDDEAVAWAKDRMGRHFNQERLDASEEDLVDALLDQGREMLRRELTKLEQYILLRIYDQAWKDHLLEMDHLKTAIMQRPLGGDQTHPQSQFAIEGRELFTQMWDRIAARVTDIIFKIQATSDGDQASPTTGTSAGGATPTLTLSHSDATGAGFSGMTDDQRAAMKAQGVEGKVATIRRDEPRVKRNDPCPCGSGKKYKQCHGKT